jgi:small subunit ribosomal protein S8
MHLISNMISIIKVGILGRRLEVVIRTSNYCSRVLQVLYRLGFIRGFVIVDKRKTKVLLKYMTINRSVIRNIKVISKPSRRVYWTKKHIETSVNHRSSSGYILVSTSSGILTNYECQNANIGGEAILSIS